MDDPELLGLMGRGVELLGRLPRNRRVAIARDEEDRAGRDRGHPREGMRKCEPFPAGSPEGRQTRERPSTAVVEDVLLVIPVTAREDDGPDPRIFGGRLGQVRRP